VSDMSKQPETLKKIAEAMGYETDVYIENSGRVNIWVKSGKDTKYPEQPSLAPKVVTDRWDIFSPETNPAQLVEVEDFVFNKPMSEIGCVNGQWYYKDGIVSVYGGTRKDVIMQAAAKQVGE